MSWTMSWFRGTFTVTDMLPIQLGAVMEESLSLQWKALEGMLETLVPKSTFSRLEQ